MSICASRGVSIVRLFVCLSFVCSFVRSFFYSFVYLFVCLFSLGFLVILIFVGFLEKEVRIVKEKEFGIYKEYKVGCV